MLKVKDNVDLKELEKFGFEPRYNEYGDVYKYALMMKSGGFCSSLIDVFSFNADTYEIDCYNGVFFKVVDVLYDLIKADLVEKVSDGNE